MKHSVLAVFIITVLLAACNGNNAGNKPGGDTTHTIAAVALPAPVNDLYTRVNTNPDNNNLRLQLAYALDSIGQPVLALAQMDSLIKRDSTNDRLWLNRGSFAENAKDTIKAMESYARALRINESPGGMLSLANLYAEKKNPRALLICSRIKDLALGREFDANAAFISGIYYARTGDRSAALQKFDESISENYTFMEAYIEKGMVYFDNRQYAEALKVFKFAAIVNSLYADAYYYQARCYEMMNNKDSAILRFKQSLGLDKNLQEAHNGLKRLNAE